MRHNNFYRRHQASCAQSRPPERPEVPRPSAHLRRAPDRLRRSPPGDHGAHRALFRPGDRRHIRPPPARDRRASDKWPRRRRSQRAPQGFADETDSSGEPLRIVLVRFWSRQGHPALRSRPHIGPDQHVFEWARWGSNPRPRDYESPALTAELQARTTWTVPRTNGADAITAAWRSRLRRRPRPHRPRATFRPSCARRGRRHPSPRTPPRPRRCGRRRPSAPRRHREPRLLPHG
jgi:hypothetical protein